MKRIRKYLLSVFILSFVILTLLPTACFASAYQTAEGASFVSRSDGVWLWPLPQEAYNTFSDWAGCNGSGNCPFCGYYHEDWGDEVHLTDDGHGHNGIDVGVIAGTSVYASADGTMYCTSENWPSRGILTVIEHPAGTDDNGDSWSYYSFYQHLSWVDTSLDGCEVKAGDKIAETGNTGGSTSDHLHFGILLAKSGQGYTLSRNPNTALSAIQNKCWVLEEGYTEGQILNNPALNSPCGFPTGNTAVVPPLTAHAGSVMYTFDKDEVAIGKSYLSECTPYVSFITVKITGSTTFKTLPCSKKTNPDSLDIRNGVLGETLEVKNLWENTEGNYWYEVEVDGQTGYLFAGDAERTDPYLTDILNYYSVDGYTLWKDGKLANASDLFTENQEG